MNYIMFKLELRGSRAHSDIIWLIKLFYSMENVHLNFYFFLLIKMFRMSSTGFNPLKIQ